MSDRPDRSLVDFDAITLKGKKVSQTIGPGVTAFDDNQLLDGSPNLMLTVHDARAQLVASGIFDSDGNGKLDNEIDLVDADGTGYRMGQVQKQGKDYTLTMELLVVSALRDQTGSLRIRRDTISHVDFARRLVDEAGQAVGRTFGFVTAAPGGQETAAQNHADSLIADAQARGQLKIAEARARRDQQRKPGMASRAKLTVKGAPADAEQIHVMELALTEAARHSPPPNALLALVEAITVECEFRNNQGSGADSISYGVIQNIPGTSAGVDGTFTKAQALDVAYSVKSALLPPGPTSKGGLIKLTNEHPEWTPGEVAARAINGGGDPQYAAKCNSWAAEAAKTIKAFGGGDVPYATATAGKAATTRTESLLRTPQLVRGTQQDRNEDSWTAMRRIAADYGYRCFAIGNDVYYISDEALMRSRPHVTISEGSAGVDTIDWEWTPRKAVNTTTVFCRAASWLTPAGAVVVLEDTDLADGRWLVSTYRQSRFSPNATVELIRGTSLLKPRVPLEHYTRKVTLPAIPGTVGGAKGKVVIDPNANLPGRPMQKSILAYVAAMAGIYGKPIVVTTGTNHNQYTVDGNVSDHFAGNAADLGMVANGGSDDSPVGDRLATAALMLAGVSNEQATQMASRELVFTKVHNGLHINILWRTYVGGNHHNHVHVGVRPA